MMFRVIGNMRSHMLRQADRFGRAAAVVLIARVLQNANGFLLSVLIVHRFGLSGAGTLAIANVAIAVLALVGTFGLTYTIARLGVSIAERNTLGLFGCVMTLPITFPLVALLGIMVGQSHEEAAVIAVLALGGPFFAQNNIASALQVLQGKVTDSVIPPIGNLLGLAFATIFASNFLDFAIVLAVFRFASIIVVFWRLPCSPVSLRTLFRHLSDGARFLTADAINLGTDQAAVLIVSYIVSRGELGLFGLCRQMLTVSDTPGWSQIQASYPAVVADPRREIPLLVRRLLWTGVLCATGVAVLTVPLGHWVYHVPGFVVLAPLLQTSTPVRYLLAVYDTRLRAIGAVARCNRVSLVRGVIALLIIPAGAWAGGAFGAVVATVINVIIATGITSQVRIDDIPVARTERVSAVTPA